MEPPLITNSPQSVFQIIETGDLRAFCTKLSNLFKNWIKSNSDLSKSAKTQLLSFDSVFFKPPRSPVTPDAIQSLNFIFVKEFPPKFPEKRQFLQFINMTDPFSKRSLVHWAAASNQFSILHWLLTHVPGVKINHSSQSGWTPFISCCSAGYPDICQLFLKLHKKPTFLNEEKETTLDSQANSNPKSIPACQVNKPNNQLRSPLSYASSKGHVDIVSLLIADPRVRMTKDSITQNPFFRACTCGKANVVKVLLLWLLDQGAKNKPCTPSKAVLTESQPANEENLIPWFKSSQESIFHILCENGDFDLIRTILRICIEKKVQKSLLFFLLTKYKDSDQKTCRQRIRQTFGQTFSGLTEFDKCIAFCV